MRTVVGILAVLLIASAISNVFLWRRGSQLEQDIRNYQSILARHGRSVGGQQAEHDFGNGKPRWYDTGEPGVSIPADKLGRQLVNLGCVISDYDRAFVETYNTRMDELFAQRSDSSDGKGYPDGAANGSQPSRSDRY